MVYINYKINKQNPNMQLRQIINCSDDESIELRINPQDQSQPLSNPFQKININQITVRRNIIIILITSHDIIDVKIMKKLNPRNESNEIDFTKTLHIFKESLLKRYYINIIRFNCQALTRQAQNQYTISYKKPDNLWDMLMFMRKVSAPQQHLFAINKNSFKNNQLIILNKVQSGNQLMVNYGIMVCLKVLVQDYKVNSRQDGDKQKLLEDIFVWFKLFWDHFHRNDKKIIAYVIQNIQISEYTPVNHTMLLFYFLQSVTYEKRLSKNAFDYLSSQIMMKKIAFQFDSKKLFINVCPNLPYSKELAAKYIEMQIIYSIIQKQNEKQEISEAFIIFLLTGLLQRTACFNISPILQFVSILYPKIVIALNKTIRQKLVSRIKKEENDEDKYDIQDYFNIRIQYINDLVKVLNQDQAQSTRMEFLDDLILFLQGKFDQNKHFDIYYQKKISELFVNQRGLSKKNELKMSNCKIAQFYWKCKYLAFSTNNKFDFTFIFQPFLQQKVVHLFNYDLSKATLALMIHGSNQKKDLKTITLLFKNYTIDYFSLTNIIIELIKNRDRKIYNQQLYQEIIEILVNRKQFRFQLFLVAFNKIYNKYHEEYREQLKGYFSLFLNKFAKIHTYCNFFIAQRTQSAIMECQQQLEQIHQNRKHTSIDYSILQNYYRQVFKLGSNQMKEMFIQHINQQGNLHFPRNMGQLQDYLNQFARIYE